MNHPPLPSTRGFQSRTHAAEHLADHVLTRPEAHDWSILLPDYRTSAGSCSDDALHAFATNLFARPAFGDEMLRRYVNAILEAIKDAVHLGWWWETRGRAGRFWRGLGLAGIFVVWDARVIRTGFLMANASRPPKRPVDRSVNPLPRRNRVLRMRPLRPDTPHHRYEIFKGNHYCVSKEYESAYYQDEVYDAGGEIFVDPLRAPRISGWERLLAERPSRLVGLEAGK